MRSQLEREDTHNQKLLEGKHYRSLIKNEQKKQKMYKQLVQLVNEPYNLRNVLKLDEFNMSVWDVQYNDPSSMNPFDSFKKKTEINFDVNYFYKPEHKDEVEDEEVQPKKLVEYGEKN